MTDPTAAATALQWASVLAFAACGFVAAWHFTGWWIGREAGRPVVRATTRTRR